MSDSNSNTAGQAQHPMVSSIYRSPLTASVVSKLVSQPTSISSSGIRNAKTGAEASRGELFNSSLEIQQKIRDAENGMELFPDIEISKQTVVSSILAPNNMTQEDMNILLEHPFLPSNVSSEILTFVKEEFISQYEIQDKVFTILENALFKEGAHVELVLPESAVDHLINDRPTVRVESIHDVRKMLHRSESNAIGFLGFNNDAEKFRAESFTGHETQVLNPLDRDGVPLSNFITVSDNFAKLKQPFFDQAFISQAVRSKIRSYQAQGEKVRMEALNNELTKNRTTIHHPRDPQSIKDSELKNAIYKSPNGKTDLFLRVPDRDNLKRHSIGRPLRMHPPMESCIPVHFPGQPERHIGAFFLIDQSGYFLSKDSQRSFIMSAQTHLNQVVSNTSVSNSTNNISSSLLEKAKNNLKGADTTIPLTYLSEIFGSLLEEDLLKRVRNGIYSTEAAISRNNDIYSVMLARALCGAVTQIVYIPKEFFTYFAFQFNNNGTGRSLLTDVSNLISLRAVSLYAKVANQVRNAISITDVSLELDPRDPTPQRTIEKVIDLASQSRTQFFPWGLNTPTDISNWWHRAGFQFHVTGHPGIPSTKIEYSQRNHDKNSPPIDEDDSLNDMIHLHFGVTPEMRDAGAGAQFATSIANSNILFTKRIIQYQKTANKLLSDYLRVVCYNDGFITKKIRKIIKDNWGNISSSFEDSLKNFAENDEDKAREFFMDEVIDALTVELPKPDMTNITNQMENFKEFKEAVDETIDFIISDDALSQAIFGETTEALVVLKEPIKAQIFRDWMQDNNFLPQLFEITEVNEHGEASSLTLKAIPEYLKKMATNLTDFMKSYKPIAVAVTKDVNEQNGVEPEENLDNPDPEADNTNSDWE